MPDQRVYGPAAYSAIAPQSLLDYIGAQFMPLGQALGTSQFAFGAMPQLATASSVPLMTQPSLMPETWKSYMPQVEQATRTVSYLPDVTASNLQRIGQGLGDVFGAMPSVAADLLAGMYQQPTSKLEAFRQRMEARQRAGEHMRRVRAMGPQAAMMYGALSGELTPSQMIQMAGPAALLGLAQMGAAVDAARLQALGQAAPAFAQAYAQPVSAVPQALVQLAMSPLQAALQSQQQRLQAAQLAQMPYMTAMQVYPEVSRQWLSAATTPGMIAADVAKAHQMVALGILPELLGLGATAR